MGKKNAKVTFTERYINSLKTPDKRVITYDAKIQGLGIKQAPSSGRITYFWFRGAGRTAGPFGKRSVRLRTLRSKRPVGPLRNLTSGLRSGSSTAESILLKSNKLIKKSPSAVPQRTTSHATLRCMRPSQRRPERTTGGL